MFDAVESLTEPDDVVAAPKARAMVLETGRPSIQVDDYRPIPPDVDVSLIVAERNSRVADAARSTHPDQFTEVWENPTVRAAYRTCLNGSGVTTRHAGSRQQSPSASTKGAGSSSTASP